MGCNGRDHWNTDRLLTSLSKDHLLLVLNENPMVVITQPAQHRRPEASAKIASASTTLSFP